VQKIVNSQFLSQKALCLGPGIDSASLGPDPDSVSLGQDPVSVNLGWHY
jgi:hypothetical protein